MYQNYIVIKSRISNSATFDNYANVCGYQNGYDLNHCKGFEGKIQHNRGPMKFNVYVPDPL